jgi:hypothetical protein
MFFRDAPVGSDVRPEFPNGTRPDWEAMIIIKIHEKMSLKLLLVRTHYVL